MFINYYDGEIIAFTLELFKNPKIYFIHQEIRAERDRSLQLCLRHKQTKLPSMPIWNPDSEYQPRSGNAASSRTST